uniref:(northern house mosquito) hypothetical protein n=1 Tax=Culex pipiens TaxID=7175 RepID=A0A8D8IC93_CULPI
MQHPLPMPRHRLRRGNALRHRTPHLPTLGCHRSANLPPKLGPRRVRLQRRHLGHPYAQRPQRTTHVRPRRAALVLRRPPHRRCPLVRHAGGVQPLPGLLVATGQRRRNLPDSVRRGGRKRRQSVHLPLVAVRRRGLRGVSVPARRLRQRQVQAQARSVPAVRVAQDYGRVHPGAAVSADVRVSVGRVRGASWMDAGLEVRLGPTGEPHPATPRPGPDPAGQLLRVVQQLIAVTRHRRSWQHRHHKLKQPQQQQTRIFQRLERVLEVIDVGDLPPDAGHLQRDVPELGQRERHPALSRTHLQRSYVPLGLGGNRLPASVLGHV